MNQLSDLIHLICTEPHSSVRTIADRVGVSKSSVQRYRTMIQSGGYSWQTLKRKTSEKLDRLFNRRERRLDRQTPNFAKIAEQLSTKGVTLYLLWEEYRGRYGERALSYSRFTHLFRRYGRRTAPVVMRQTHEPGQTAFVDYSGARPWYVDAKGQKIEVELFVGVLAASNYLFAYCTRSQNVSDWIDANRRMLEYFGGSPKVIVPDNLRAAVTQSGRCGTLQKDYQRFAEHYGIAVHPARPYKPRDKGKVEGAVRIVQRRILAPLRNRVFHSLEEINAACAARLKALNRRPMDKLPSSRRDVFLATEQSALMALPSTPYVHAEWTKRLTVPRDYHVKVADHRYSVPYTLVGQSVDARLTGETVQFYCARRCVATHCRSAVRGAHTTDPAHQAPAHRAQAERTREGFLHWAQGVGPHMRQVVAHQFEGKVALQGLPACDALRNLARHEETAVLERAAAKAVKANRLTVVGVMKGMGQTWRAKRAQSHADYARSRRARRREGVGLLRPKAQKAA